MQFRSETVFLSFAAAVRLLLNIRSILQKTPLESEDRI